MGIVGNQEDLYNTAPPQGFFSSAMDTWPGFTTTMGWNLGRASNTITGGGTAGRLGRLKNMAFRARGAEGSSLMAYGEKRGMGGFLGMHGGGISQTVSPLHWRRLSRPANIDPSFYGKHGGGIYTPFQGLSGIGNSMFNRVEGPLSKIAPEFMKGLKGESAITKGEEMFSAGTLGRIRSFGKISGMSTGQLAGQRGVNVMSAIHDINPGVFKAWEAAGGIEGLTPELQRVALRSGVASTITSRISGRVGGYVQGAEAAALEKGGLTGAVDIAKGRASGFALEGVEKGAAAFLRESKIGTFVGKGGATKLLRGANIAGWVLLAHDLAEGAGKLVAGGVKTAIEAAQSAKGSIDKPIMGMGFKDNTVASTARQRGVLAISNSRLNARSALGSEGAMMAARFG